MVFIKKIRKRVVGQDPGPLQRHVIIETPLNASNAKFSTLFTSSLILMESLGFFLRSVTIYRKP